MKAITIIQPYAHLIVIGQKPIENRRYYIGHRGPIAIHAGKNKSWLDPHDERNYPDMAFGAIVGVAEITDCVKLVTLRRMSRYIHLHHHLHAEGPWCWILENVIRLETPIPWRGQQGMFDVPDDVVAEQLATAGSREDA